MFLFRVLSDMILLRILVSVLFRLLIDRVLSRVLFRVFLVFFRVLSDRVLFRVLIFRVFFRIEFCLRSSVRGSSLVFWFLESSLRSPVRFYWYPNLAHSEFNK